MKSLKAEASYNLEARVKKIYHCKHKMSFRQGPVQSIVMIQTVDLRRRRKGGNEMSKTRLLTKP
jgi:hypothetical protein